MADIYTEIGLTEADDIYSPNLTPDSGTLTISSVTVRLKDSAETTVSGMDGIAATGFDAGAQAAPQAWHLISPTALALSVGLYTLAFRFTDSNGLIRIATVGLTVKTDSSV